MTENFMSKVVSRLIGAGVFSLGVSLWLLGVFIVDALHSDHADVFRDANVLHDMDLVLVSATSGAVLLVLAFLLAITTIRKSVNNC